MATAWSGSFVPEVQDDDDVSITSTDHEGNGGRDEDRDWVVDDLLAERPHPDIPGQMQYLIKWEGFPIDECTWEPEDNLGPGLLPQWEETKKEIEAGKRTPYDINIYNAACMAKTERHMRRNAKRKRLGLPLTTPFPPETVASHLSHSISGRDDSDSDEEAETMDDILARVAAKSQPRPAIKQKIFEGNALKPRTESSPPRPANARRSSGMSTPKPPSNPQSGKPATRPSEPARRASAGATTGYQGTARKPSIITNQNTSKPPTSKTPTQRPSSAAAKPPPSTTQPIRSSTLANKFAGKKMTATRTRQPPPAQIATATNVFVSGKERKKRTNLGDVMVDTSKAPKRFSNMHVQNLARKRAIEKGDAAPNFSSIPAGLFLNTSDAQIRPKDKNPSFKSPIYEPQTDPMKTNATSALSASSSLVHSPAANPSGDEPAPAPKAKKKSVRFTAVEDDEPDTGTARELFDEPMDIDSPLEVPEVPAIPETPQHPQAARPKLSLAKYQERGQTQVVLRRATFGPGSSQEVRVMFHGISRHNDPWLTAFMDNEKLHFDATCSSIDFLSQKGWLLMERFSAGTIKPNAPDQASMLENIAEWLRRSSSAMHLVTSDFSILVYPNGADAWRELDSDTDAVRLEAPLRHLIYKTKMDTRLYQHTVPAISTAEPAGVPHGPQCQLIVKQLAGLDFDKWLPQEPNKKDTQVYMLLIPNSEPQLLAVIKVWLRSCQPECRIFTFEREDSWLKFHEVVSAGAAGTVVVHSDVTCSLGKIPGIWNLVDNNPNTFWDLSVGEFDPPRFPSELTATIEPGTLQMTRLFPFGRAFLITPSFVLSDPAQLVKLLEWARANFWNPQTLIMACADFPGYLRNVTLDIEQEHHALCHVYREDPNLDRILEQYGRRKEDVWHVFRAWELTMELQSIFGDQQTSEDLRKLSWITDFIDPNDEQSLVNYFCWWSTTKLDRYRRFLVLGSHPAKIKRAYRHIQVPVYTDISVSDPDVAAARADTRQEAAEVAEETGDEAGDSGRVGGIASESLVGHRAQSPPGQRKMSVSRAPFTFPSALFHDDQAKDLKGWIRDHIASLGPSWSKLHVNPVAWVNPQMADQFGDDFCSFDTFRNWLLGAPTFSQSVNTWYGLFYSIDKPWNPEQPLSRYGRHPWIAIFRPVEPHKFRDGFSRYELFIWDLSAGERESTTGRWGGLLGMQRQLIDFVRLEVPKKYKGTALTNVWVSSKTKVLAQPGQNPLDITCDKIKEMFGNGRYWLPPFHDMLSDRGWKSLNEIEWKTGMSIDAANTRLMAIPRNASDAGKLERSIWHPPRGVTLNGGQTICLNALYEATLKERLKDPLCETMRYQYKPTTEWYADQVSERRDFSYVCVDAAERILRKLLAPKV
ncbi:Uu.00g063360.m01.CDS01 [Anthostomella pinea]|uniref:Uu.00g063360.m01.CDS01 n=1 Tax=Anthostomella pinea TaxID=933095 RepID=A0AAI8VTC6_9PEZI|nr:Uu.00g063360.m01.CDS01 [Anthostomella pinea]